MTRAQGEIAGTALHYGVRVMIRDGSKLDGVVGTVFRVNDGEVQVLLDREVFWLVKRENLELLK